MRVETSAALKLGKSKKGGTRQEQKGRKEGGGRGTALYVSGADIDFRGIYFMFVF